MNLILPLYTLALLITAPTTAMGQDVLDQVGKTALTKSTGTPYQFKRVRHKKFTRAILAPDGKIWSERLPGEFNQLKADGSPPDLAPTYEAPDQRNNHRGRTIQTITQSNATEACLEIGGRLPTRVEYDQLQSYFQMSTDGELELDQIFPDMKEHGFWSSTENEILQGLAYYYMLNVGHSIYSETFKTLRSVRCVSL